jgi:hypothetical protein
MAHRIVRSLIDVFPRQRLGDNGVEGHVHVGSDGGVAVFVEGEGGGGVLEEEEEDSDLR